jgi:hypothetical protein
MESHSLCVHHSEQLKQLSRLRLGGLRNDVFEVAASMPAGKSQFAIFS